MKIQCLVPLCLFLPAVLAQQVSTGEYAVPTYNASPLGITAGPDGALWFTEYEGNKIGRVTIAASFTEFPIPTAASFPYGIASGPDGALWFAETAGNKIGRLAVTGGIDEYKLPTSNSQPSGIVAGSDGALWFTEQNGNRIGRISVAGAITEYPVSDSSGWIASGSDGALWFTEYLANKIGRITTSGSITEYTVPTASSGPKGIAPGPDGALWFTEYMARKIGRIATSGAIIEYSLSTGQFDGNPLWITTGPDGALWFTDSLQGSGEFGRLNPTTPPSFTGYSISAYGNTPSQIVCGPGGALWFTAFGSYLGFVGEAVFPSARLQVNPAVGPFRDELTFSGSAFAPNEIVDIWARGVGSKVMGSARADANGSVTITAQEPVSTVGQRLFLGTGRSSGKLGAANFTVRTRIALSPVSGSAGNTVQVRIFGLGPLEQVNVYWNKTSLLVGTAVADVNGSAALTVTVPENAANGYNIFVGQGQVTKTMGQAPFTVE